MLNKHAQLRFEFGQSGKHYVHKVEKFQEENGLVQLLRIRMQLKKRPLSYGDNEEGFHLSSRVDSQSFRRIEPCT